MRYTLDISPKYRKFSIFCRNIGDFQIFGRFFSCRYRPIYDISTINRSIYPIFLFLGYNELKQFLLTSGFLNSTADTSLFILHRSTVTIYLLVYVDDIIITGNNPLDVQHFITLLFAWFSLKDLGSLTYFLGVEVLSHQHDLIIS